MPELPEVETVRRGLAPFMEGARIASVALNREGLRFPFSPGMARRMEGRQVVGLERRAKYLICHLDSGESVIMHLGMSGSFRVEETDPQSGRQSREPGHGHTPGAFYHPRSAARAHDHVVLYLEAGADRQARRIVYNDPRRFGFMIMERSDVLHGHPLLAGLGIEPVSNALSAATLAPLLSGRKAPLKAVLLDQRVIAGLGNIYVCEALHGAGLSPRRRAASLVRAGGEPTERLERLVREIRDVIARAIEAGGSSLRDHRLTDGSLGYFQHTFRAYDREGEPCPAPACGGTIRRITQSGRSTFYCPSCQR